MASILQSAVDTVNGLASTTLTIFTSFITFNYHLGGLVFTCLTHLLTLVTSVLTSVALALRIMLEDLVVFLAEIWETLASILTGLETCLNLALGLVAKGLGALAASAANLYTGAATNLALLGTGLTNGLTNIRFFFDLLGRSVLLLCNLVPRSLYVLYVTGGAVVGRVARAVVAGWHGGKEVLATASPPVLVGMVVGVSSSLLLLHLSSREWRRRGITTASLASSVLTLTCKAYIVLIRCIARLVGLVFTMVEMTISHLRVPMFAHAGDSDDEEEDREGMVGEVEEETEEEREKMEMKRRNYKLVVERAGRKRGQDTVEDQLLRQMENEREDKLCVVCQDNEKCIMILPCRHLCICEACQEPLRQIRNTCPICRKGVKQMIKAYL